MEEPKKIIETIEEEKKQTWKIGKNFFGEPMIIYPWKIDNKINYKNLIIGGSWSGFFGWIIFIAIILFCANAYFNDMNNMVSLVECYRNPFYASFEYNCSSITTNWERSIGVYNPGMSDDYLFNVNVTNDETYIYPGFKSPINDFINKIKEN